MGTLQVVLQLISTAERLPPIDDVTLMTVLWKCVRLVEWSLGTGAGTARQAPERMGKMGTGARNIYTVVNERHSYHGNTSYLTIS